MLTDLTTVMNQVESSCQLGDVSFEYWTGGGLPPPYYRSDQLRLLTINGQYIMEYSRPRFDIAIPEGEADNSGAVVEKFFRIADSHEIARFTRMLRDAAVFTQHYPEENNRGFADSLSTEIIVTVKDETFLRKYIGKIPDALTPLDRLVRQFIDTLMKTGTRQLAHRGKPISNQNQ